MIEISFWKILVVMVIALVVLGPQQLPKAARLLGRFIGKMQNLIASAQKELKAVASEEQEPSRRKPE